MNRHRKKRLLVVINKKVRVSLTNLLKKIATLLKASSEHPEKAKVLYFLIEIPYDVLYYFCWGTFSFVFKDFNYF